MYSPTPTTPSCTLTTKIRAITLASSFAFPVSDTVIPAVASTLFFLPTPSLGAWSISAEDV